MMNRTLLKRLEALETQISTRSLRPKIVRSSKPRKTAEEMEQRMYEEAEKRQKEYERLIVTPEHKRMMLEPTEKGHRYRQTFFRTYLVERLRTQLYKELGEVWDWRTAKQREREQLAANKAYAESRGKRNKLV